jgi:hypothetical protein
MSFERVTMMKRSAAKPQPKSTTTEIAETAETSIRARVFLWTLCPPW